ncbi:hypothetical protein IJF81_01730 [bacterium]|nr:hypothetical protein [bacterium]
MSIIYKLIRDIPIMIVLCFFVLSVLYCAKNYLKVSGNIKLINMFLLNFNKNDLSFRFKEIDEWMSNNPYVMSTWSDFKTTLVFSESIALKNKDNDLTYKNLSSNIQTVQTTVDPLYFFNEDNLVYNKFNNKFLQSVATILTGCGPLFTFLNIAIAFGRVDLSSQEATVNSMSGLMASMQIAALVSVIAVGSSLLFIIFERIAHNFLCRIPMSNLENTISNLFDNITSEKFLLELIKETKIQNNSISNLITAMPDNVKTAFNSGITTNLVPYLENLIFGLNQLNKNLKDRFSSLSGNDDVDSLF